MVLSTHHAEYHNMKSLGRLERNPDIGGPGQPSFPLCFSFAVTLTMVEASFASRVGEKSSLCLYCFAFAFPFLPQSV